MRTGKRWRDFLSKLSVTFRDGSGNHSAPRPPPEKMENAGDSGDRREDKPRRKMISRAHARRKGVLTGFYPVPLPFRRQSAAGGHEARRSGSGPLPIQAQKLHRCNSGRDGGAHEPGPTKNKRFAEKH